MTIVEKIARIISEHDRMEVDEAPGWADWHWEERSGLAREIIARGMREPTSAMIQAGDLALTSGEGVAAAYRAMVDAAIKEYGPRARA